MKIHLKQNKHSSIIEDPELIEYYLITELQTKCNTPSYDLAYDVYHKDPCVHLIQLIRENPKVDHGFIFVFSKELKFKLSVVIEILEDYDIIACIINRTLRILHSFYHYKYNYMNDFYGHNNSILITPSSIINTIDILE